MLRDPTSRGLYVRVWPPHTSERRGGGGGCEQEPSKFLSSLDFGVFENSQLRKSFFPTN